MITPVILVAHLVEVLAWPIQWFPCDSICLSLAVQRNTEKQVEVDQVEEELIGTFESSVECVADLEGSLQLLSQHLGHHLVVIVD